MKAETEFERRLREILTEYPEIDPARAALSLKGQPEATNEQIAQLSKFRPGEAERGTPKPSKRTATPSDLARLFEEEWAKKHPELPRKEVPSPVNPVNPAPKT